MPLDDKIEQFMIERTGTLRHSNRPFYEHLRGVHDLLEQEGAPEYVCLAGLCHSIYGTNAFKQQAAQLAERALISAAIGEKAEWLAFGVCCRPRPPAVMGAAPRGPPYYVISRHSNEMLVLSPPDLADLLKIEEAN